MSGLRITAIACALALVLATLSLTGRAQEPVTLRIYIPGAGTPAFTKPFEDAVEAWNRANPAIRVRLSIFGWGEIQTKVLTELAAGIGPDIWMHGGAAAALFASTGEALPLDPHLRRWGRLPDYFERLIDEVTYEDRIHAVPMQASNIGPLFYRRDLFREAGLDPHRPPQDWASLKAAARQLTRRDGGRLVRAGFFVPYEGHFAQMVWATFLWANGGELLTPDRRRAAFNSPEGVEALEYYASFVREGILIPGVIESAPRIPHLVTGRVAMAPGGSFDVGVMEGLASPEVYEEIAVAPPVAGRAGRATLAGQNVFFIARRSRNPDAAWRVIEYMLRDDVHLSILSHAGFMPVRKSQQNAAYLRTNPRFPVFAGSMRWARGNPNIPRWIEVRTRIVRAIEEVIQGRRTAKEALDEAARDVDAILARR
jgi:multiple sugar transport system substrate-binding protein